MVLTSTPLLARVVPNEWRRLYIGIGFSAASRWACLKASRIPLPDTGLPPLSPVGETGSFARGHGQINLEANTVSGILCQEDRVRNQPTRAITMTVEHHLVYHSHYAVMWGFPGNIMKIILRVRASNDPKCEVGTVGRATLFASYNGVRSDSVQFFFPAACRDHDHLYHGPQVNNQVPPL
jgi:hypothetical protein